MKKTVLLLFSNRSLFIIKTSNEVDSFVADGYTLFDFNVGYNWRNMVFGIQI
jgi:hypothetical protein